MFREEENAYDAFPEIYSRDSCSTAEISLVFLIQVTSASEVPFFLTIIPYFSF